jgi:hypothetical protein
MRSMAAPLSQRRPIWIIGGFVACSILFTLLQDYVYTLVHRSAFYFSESLLFSSFWALFLPLGHVQFVRSRHSDQKVLLLALWGVPLLLHLLLFPALVWTVSRLFYYHTFAYGQTFGFMLSAYLYPMVGLYALIPVWHFFTTVQKKPLPPPAASLRVLLVQDGLEKIAVPVADIRFIRADTPYVALHLNDKKYLFSDTLAALEQQLDNRQFVRVHKSTILNLAYVQSYTSRLNGDYDAHLTDGVSVRISRNYASVFKVRFAATRLMG